MTPGAIDVPVDVPMDVAVVTPVYGNQETLEELVGRLDAALAGRRWRLRFVIDGSPDGSLAVARALAAGDDRLAVTDLRENVGQHRALTRGLAEEASAHSWVCLDADLQDPPEAVPVLLDRLAASDVGAVFAGRRGSYEGRVRSATGRLHRRVLGRISRLPRDAGAFVALGPAARDAVVALRSPSIVAAIGASGVPVASVPVMRSTRPSGRSAWTTSARVAQSGRTLAWAVRARAHGPGDAEGGGGGDGDGDGSHRCTTTTE